MKKDRFIEDYAFSTIEGMAVALLIATISLIGIYLFLIIPAFFEVWLIFYIIKYKKIKFETESAITSLSQNLQGSDEEIKKEKFRIRKDYFKKQEELMDLKNRYFIYGVALFLTSLLLTVIIPKLEEYDKSCKHDDFEKSINYNFIQLHQKIELINKNFEDFKKIKSNDETNRKDY